MKIALYMKGLDCANCAEKIRAASEKNPFVKTAEMNFMAKKLNLEIAEGSDEAVIREVKKITAELEPDVEVMLSEPSASHDREEDSSDLKRDLIKIIASVVIFIIGLVFHGNAYALWIFLAAYFIVGLDVLVAAGQNIIKGRPFDECFLMTAATIGAFCIGEYHEGVVVMILYQLGEMFQSLAVRRSRNSITSLMDIRPDVANVKNGDAIEQIAPELVKVGDIIVVKP
ncbi:MAG: heavy metal translocating P-type ATPase, partial [Oscillospiraceae bacterium]|nr:heavy metal translocating P-type ATPase [Oscillospiraceae bacterium]